MRKFSFTILLVFAVWINAVPAAIAQETADKKNWQYLGELYLMFPNMSGETAIKNLPPVEVDASSGDILGSLEMGAMFYLEATNDDWAISSDFLYMKLGQDLESNAIVTSGEITMKQYSWEIAGLKRVTPWLDAGLAGRIVSLEVALDLETIGNTRNNEATETWFDPVVVVRSNHLFKEKWLAQMRLDAGGFGIGSDFTWQLQANVGYRFSELFQTTLGYRYIGIDYDKGEGADRFVYDVDTYGFVLKLGFNF